MDKIVVTEMLPPSKRLDKKCCICHTTKSVKYVCNIYFHQGKTCLEGMYVCNKCVLIRDER